MKKPIRPLKPLKTLSPPVQKHRVCKQVFRNYDTDELVLIDEDKEIVDEEFWDKFEHVTRLDLSMVDKIRKIIPSNVENFDIDFDFDRDGYTRGLIITFWDNKNEEHYNIELYNYQNRFEKYEEDMLQWGKDMVKYNEFKRTEKLQKLQKEIEKLSK